MGGPDSDLAVFSSFGALSIFLLAGKVLRTRVTFLRSLYLPSSVIGGFLALILGSVCSATSPELWDFTQQYYQAAWSQLPGILINAIFASVFIGVDVPPMKAIWEASGPQIAYGQIVTHGLWGIGLLVGWMLSLFGMCGDKCPSFFGMMLYVGFEGGHGTVGGLTKSFTETMDWPQGKDVCLVSATAGLVGSTLVGVTFVNIAMRRGWLASSAEDSEEAADPLLLVGIYSPDNRPPLGYHTVASDSIDTLSLHAACLGLAIFFGYAMKRGMTVLESVLKSNDMTGLGEIFASFPLFPLCMMGGIVVQLITKYCVSVKVIDHHIMQRLSGLALDYLVCAAIAKMELSAMSGSAAAFLIMVGTGLAWHCFCLLFLAKRLLPDAWFERGIFELGHSMGTTANGILLLKMADKRGETSAHSASAFKLMFHEPFMGVWLACVVATLGELGPFPAMVASFVFMAGWLALLVFYFRPRYGRETAMSALATVSSKNIMEVTRARAHSEQLPQTRQSSAEMGGVRGSTFASFTNRM